MTFEPWKKYLTIGGSEDGKLNDGAVPRFERFIPNGKENYIWRKLWHGRREFGFYLLESINPNDVIDMLFRGYRKV